MKKAIYMVSVLCGIMFISSCTVDSGPDARDAFVGRYDVLEIENAGTAQADTVHSYEIEVSKVSGNSEEVRIVGLNNNGFYKTGCDLIGVVGGARLLVPSNQCVITSGIYYQFNGDGYLSNDQKQILIDFTIEYCQEEPLGTNCIYKAPLRFDALRK